MARTGSKKLALAVILASATLTIMAGSLIAPVLNRMRDDLGVAPSAAGLIITTHGLFMALFSPLMGSLVDRKGARRPYIFELIGYGIAGGVLGGLSWHFPFAVYPKKTSTRSRLSRPRSRWASFIRIDANNTVLWQDAGKGPGASTSRARPRVPDRQTPEGLHGCF